MTHGFIKKVSVDVLYLKINDVLEYNLPYVQSNFMYNPGPKGLMTQKLNLSILRGTYCSMLMQKIT